MQLKKISWTCNRWGGTSEINDHYFDAPTAYGVHSTIISQRLLGFIFCRKLARTKTQQGTDKASEKNGRTVFSQALVSRVYTWFNRNGVNIILHFLSSLYTHNLPQLNCSPSLLPEYAPPPFAPGGHKRSYKRADPNRWRSLSDDGKSTARACGITISISGNLAEAINYKGEARKE